ncbi:MAG: hypothetical protein KDN22_03125, partial [Verrucomicrobiae bacterium]|nr:hypothetical protein [Verrucomicrobiae bacterium]
KRRDSEDFLIDDGDDDFESFDSAEELEDDFDELEAVDELEAEEVENDVLEEDTVVEDDQDDPLFGADLEPAPAPRPTDVRPEKAVPPIAASVAPAQANKADELLKRVGLRRAGATGLPGRASVAAEQRPKPDPNEAGKPRFAWSKPGTIPAPVATERQASVDESQRPAAKLPLPRGEESAPAAESPFTPKGFVKKKQAEPARRALPSKPAPLKLNRVAPPAAPVEEMTTPEPVDHVAPEQQNFDSTLEPRHQKGRFEKGEPTVEDGEDLDLPTFLRRKKG